MDGAYELRNRKSKRIAKLAVRGLELQLDMPPAPESKRSFPSHAAAVAAMNAELLRLTERGWVISDVRTDADRQPDPEPEPAPVAEQPARTGMTREGTRVTVDASDVAISADEACAALRAELARGCREIVISDSQPYREPWYQTVEPWCAAVMRLERNELTHFIVDTYFQPLTRQASVYCGNLTRLFQVCARLELAYVIGCSELDSLAHETLEDLTLMAEPISIGTLRAVVRGPCPSLRRLALGLSYEHGAAPDGAALLDAIVRSPIFDQLRVLSIEGNVFDDEQRALAILDRHKQPLSKLDELYLPLQDVMSRSDAELAELIVPLRGVEESQVFTPSRYRTP